MDVSKARQIFFDYDGSSFFMSRDGKDEEYNEFKISKEQEEIWLEELTRTRINNLNNPGNWWSILFLNHHSKFEYLNEILKVEPKGELWEKCAFLEELNKYCDNAGFEKKIADRCKEYIINHATNYLTSSKSNEMKIRLETIIKTSR